MWAIKYRILLIHLDKLLNTQQRVLSSLPKSSKTFLTSNTVECEISIMEDCDENTSDEYMYFGVEQDLQFCVNTILHPDNILELKINIDNMKIFKSSIKTMWPILIKVHFQPDIYKLFIAAAYVGNSKSKSINLFLKDFITKINFKRGIMIHNEHLNIKIKCFICDMPASYLKCFKDYNSKYDCERLGMLNKY